MRFGNTAQVLAECKLEYYRISECEGYWTTTDSAKVLAECKLKFYRISECDG